MVRPVPRLPPHYHVGIVVPDVDEARARLSGLLGVRWGPVVRFDEVPYRDATGADIVLPSTICYSADEPFLEVIEETPGTVWERNEHSNLHHVGFWSDDLSGDSDALSGGGCPLQLCGREGSVAPTQFAYHRDEVLGVRFELVDASIREMMAPLFEPDPGAPG